MTEANSNNINGFSTSDFIVFLASLLLCVAIGGFYAYKDRKKKVDNYYFGGKKISPIPLGISMSVTFISAVTVLGYPTESYVYGIISLWYAFTLVIPNIIACLYYIPLIHRLQVTTIYEYLELRFDVKLRKLQSAIEIFNQTTYMGLTVYLPALALNAVTPLALTWTIILTSGICTFYTAFGGMKAVVWVDTIQAGIMLAGVLAVLIRTTMIVGGFNNVWVALEESGRDNFWDFNPDPTLRSTGWTILVGVSVTQSILCCCNQSICQRYLSCRTERDAKLAAVISLVPKIVISSLCTISGCVAYTYFKGCDPIKAKNVSKPDQLMPYLVLQVFRDMPGMTGFFVAAIFSGTLSTVSSGINALSSLLLEDFLVPIKPQLSQTAQMVISKVTALILGTLVTAVAYLASALGGNLVSVVLIFRGLFGGPVLATFTLGMFFPWTNAKGAFIGQIVGTAIAAWMSFGSMIHGKSPESLRKMPTSIENCTNLERANTTVHPIQDYTIAWDTTSAPEKVYNPLYAMSFMYYTSLAIFSTVVVGLIVSLLTGANKPKHMDPKLFVPFVDNKHLPDKIRTFFRFGVPEIKMIKDQSLSAKEIRIEDTPLMS
ncbi:unnamed protein product [Clavelina lepadiformis]|uniref:Sodium-coupled monocarboxylate transporter 1 n=1 Tax=Clavelina lepadiformis TaxID=159417 RepID=A0ABP0GUM4_CLALP